jgi:hypothetical protein
MERLTSRHKNVHHDERSSKLEERASRYSLSNVDGDNVVDDGVPSKKHHHHGHHETKHHKYEEIGGDGILKAPKVYDFDDTNDLENSFEKQLHFLYKDVNPEKDSHESLRKVIDHYQGDKRKLLMDLGSKYKITILWKGENLVVAGSTTEDDDKKNKRKDEKEKVQAEFWGDDDDDDDDVDALYSMDAPIVGIDKHYAEKTHEKHHMVRSVIDEAYLGGKPSDDFARSEDDGPRFELRTIENEDELGQERGKKKARMDGRQGSGAVNLLGHHYVLAGHKHTDEEGNVISKERDGKQIESDWRKADDHEGVQVERPKNEVAILFFLTLPCTLAYLCLCVEPCKLCSPKVKIGADGK